MNEPTEEQLINPQPEEVDHVEEEPKQEVQEDKSDIVDINGS